MITPNPLVSLWDMLQIDAAPLLASMVKVGQLKQQIEERKAANQTVHHSHEDIAAMFDDLEASIQGFDLRVTPLAVADCRAAFHAHQLDSDHAIALLRDVLATALRELQATLFLSLSYREAALYQPEAPLFGGVVDEAFSEVRFDIAEGGKCMAVGRYTAAVFHFMRATESAVGKLATRVGATVKNKYGETLPWGKLAGNIGGEIDKMDQGERRDRWHGTHMFLVGCNRAFRTKTAHSKATYTEEEAREIYEARGGLAKLHSGISGFSA